MRRFAEQVRESTESSIAACVLRRKNVEALKPFKSSRTGARDCAGGAMLLSSPCPLLLLRHIGTPLLRPRGVTLCGADIPGLDPWKSTP